MMEVLHPRCAGLDVHKDMVMACLRNAEGNRVKQEVRSFGTTTSGLLELEGSCELLLANAQHVRNVPGRKSDVNDAMWLADLLAHGLIRGSFVPPTPVQEMRDLTRTRK